MMSFDYRVFLRRALLVAVGVSFFVNCSGARAATGINRQINYQAKLLTSAGVPVPDGDYLIKFLIYNQESGGTPIWTATGSIFLPTNVTLNVVDGLFSVNLGDVAAGQNALDIDWHQDALYLGVIIGGDPEMTPRKRLTAVPYAFASETLQGQYASSSVSAAGGSLFHLSQNATDAASGDRTALLLSTSGTSNVFDYLIKGSNGSDVFTVSRQGNVTTTGNFAASGNVIFGDAVGDTISFNGHVASDLLPVSDNLYALGSSSLRWKGLESTGVTTTNLTFTSASGSSLVIGGRAVCLADGTNCQTSPEADTLLSVTNRGAVATSSLNLYGGVSTSNFTATGTTALQSMTFTVATGTSATTTNLFSSNAIFTNLLSTGATTTNLAFTSASGSSLTIGGQSVCLADGTNCPASGGSSSDLNWTYSLTNDFVRNATATTDIIIGGTSTSTAPAFFNLTGESASSNRLVIGGNQNMDVVIGNATATAGYGSLFQFSGNDLYVEGNTRAATSVAGEFVAMTPLGIGATYFHHGLIYTQATGLTLDPQLGGGGALNLGNDAGDTITLTGTSNFVGSAVFQGFTFGTTTGTSATTTNLFSSNAIFTNLLSTDATTTNLAFTSASGSSLTIGGQSVCLADGTNCPASGGSSSDLNWTYSLTNDFVRNATATTDIVIGGTSTSTAPAFFNLTGESASSNRLVIGGTQNMDVVIGNTTATFLNGNYFQLTGRDVYVEGGIRSSTSVATGFIAKHPLSVGAAATLYSYDGMYGLGQNLKIDPVRGGSGILTLGNDASDLISFGGKVSSDIVPDTDNSYYLGSPSLRWAGLDAVTSTFTSATTTNLSVGSYARLPSNTKINNTSVCLADGTNCLPGGGGSSGALNLQLLATSTLPGGDTGSNTTKMFVSGNYAYISVYDSGKFVIVDVSNPTSTTIVSSLSFASGISSIYVAGRYAYVTRPTSQVVNTIDISNPAFPNVTATTTIGSMQSIASIYAAGRHAYVVGLKMDVFDISNPNNPQVVASSTLSDQGSRVVAQGRYVYSSNNSTGITITDVSNASAPVQAGILQNIDSTGADLAVSGKYAYLLGFSSFQDSGDNGVVLNTIDVSNPASPTVTSTLTVEREPGGLTLPTALALSGRYAYATMNNQNTATSSLKIIDVSSSTNPVIAATYYFSDTVTPSSIFISGRYLYAQMSDFSSGFAYLYVFDIGGQEINGLVGNSAEFGNFQVRQNANIFNDLNIGGGLSIGSGGLSSQGALGIHTFLTRDTSAFIFNEASNTAPVLEVRGGCNDTSSTADLIRAGNSTDNIKFSVTCAGYVHADNTFTSPATDFAEYFNTSQQASVGDVVVIDTATSGRAVTLSTASARDLTLGVYSTKPSFAGGYTDDVASGLSSGFIPVALLGQVPTKASTVNGSIEAGDELMAGDGGIAIKANGSGMILGRALQPLVSGTGTIDVYVQPQWWAGDLVTSDGGNDSMGKNLLLQNQPANLASTIKDSPAFVFQGSAWNANSSNAIFSSFTMFNDVVSATSSLFTINGTAGTALLTISDLGDASLTGDVFVGHRLFLGSKRAGVASTSTYIYVDDTQAPTSTYIATNADGWSTASTYDYAERFMSSEDLHPGDVVVADILGVNAVKRSGSSQDVPLGIVSTKPGFITGSYATGTYPIALAGRVPTRVVTTNGVIRPGDQLAPSDIPGVAVKAVNPGPVVGIALERYDGAAEGLISVFVQTGWKGGDIASSSSTESVSQNVSAGTITSPRSGLAKILAGGTSVDISFATLNAYPLVTVTPYGVPTAKWGIQSVSDHGFTIALDHAEMFDLVFSWKAESSPQDGKVSVSDGTTAFYDSLTGQIIPIQGATSSNEGTVPDVESTSSSLESDGSSSSTPPLVIEVPDASSSTTEGTTTSTP